MNNNPFYYVDHDGQNAAVFVINILEFSFGASLGPLLLPTAAIIGTACLAYGAYRALSNVDMSANQDYEIEKKEVTTPNKKEPKDKPKESSRTEPKNLKEQLALEEAKYEPKDKAIMEGKIKDPRYPADRWKKREHIHYNNDGTKSDIHFWENIITGEREGFKFKVYGENE